MSGATFDWTFDQAFAVRDAPPLMDTTVTPRGRKYTAISERGRAAVGISHRGRKTTSLDNQ